MTNDRNANTSAIALAFTAREESSALDSTVAWGVHIIANVCGWNGAPLKGGRKVAIKMARESYGYRLDSDGAPILDAKGNRVKRSAIFNRLALVDSLIGYALKSEADWIATIHASATCPESDPEQRDSDVAMLIEQFAARLASVVKGNTIDALKHYLETGVAKVDSVADAADALQEDETPKTETETETETKSGNPADGFGDIMATLATMRGHLSAVQLDSLESFVASCRDLAAQEAQEAIADAA